MPTYDYECQKCGNTFEVFHGMSESPKVKCPKKACGGKAKKQIGAGSGLIFKGSGFYITDYKNKSGSNGNGSNGNGSESKGETKSESKSETKSEPKSESKAESKPAKTEKGPKPA